MENLNSLIGKRVNVDLIRTENWESEKYIHNGICLRITDNGQVVVNSDEQSEHSILTACGCFYPSAYNIVLV